MQHKTSTIRSIILVICRAKFGQHPRSRLARSKRLKPVKAVLRQQKITAYRTHCQLRGLVDH